MFDFDIHEKVLVILRKLSKKNRKKVEIINKKIKEIINCDYGSIERYKNLRKPLQHWKRVHIDKHFVLAFEVDKENNFILFTDFDHHDRIYRK